MTKKENEQIKMLRTVLGPTGDYPLGKLEPSDEGGLMIAILAQDGQVRIEFGTEVRWLALPPDQAIAFANHIIKRAKRIK